LLMSWVKNWWVSCCWVAQLPPSLCCRWWQGTPISQRCHCGQLVLVCKSNATSKLNSYRRQKYTRMWKNWISWIISFHTLVFSYL
jgi:hypothetical protein